MLSWRKVLSAASHLSQGTIWSCISVFVKFFFMMVLWFIRNISNLEMITGLRVGMQVRRKSRRGKRDLWPILRSKAFSRIQSCRVYCEISRFVLRCRRMHYHLFYHRSQSTIKIFAGESSRCTKTSKLSWDYDEDKQVGSCRYPSSEMMNIQITQKYDKKPVWIALKWRSWLKESVDIPEEM